VVAAVGIGPGGWILIILLLAFFAYLAVQRVRRRGSEEEGDEE